MFKNKGLIVVILLFVVIASGIYWMMKRPQDNLFTVMDVPEFEMTNQNGELINNQDMLGKVYVVEFFFTSCPTICPIMSMNLREIEDEINHPDFGIVSITIDPKRDTPERLLEYSNQIGVKSPNWHHLTADRTYIQNLSKQFNIYVEDIADATGLDHSGNFALVDKNGKIRSRYGKNNLPILYYSGLNYQDAEGKIESLTGKFHPEVEMLKQDIRLLLTQ